MKDHFKDGTYTLTLKQETPPSPGYPDKDPRVIPIAVGLLNPNGDEVVPTTVDVTTRYTKDYLVFLRGEVQTLLDEGGTLDDAYKIDQSAYAELYFTDRRWPDFTAEDFDRAVAWYHRRNRTFGVG